MHIFSDAWSDSIQNGQMQLKHIYHGLITIRWEHGTVPPEPTNTVQINSLMPCSPPWLNLCSGLAYIGAPKMCTQGLKHPMGDREPRATVCANIATQRGSHSMQNFHAPPPHTKTNIELKLRYQLAMGTTTGAPSLP